jgi:hypothetical protein
MIHRRRRRRHRRITQHPKQQRDIYWHCNDEDETSPYLGMRRDIDVGLFHGDALCVMNGKRKWRRDDECSFVFVGHTTPNGTTPCIDRLAADDLGGVWHWQTSPRLLHGSAALWLSLFLPTFSIVKLNPFVLHQNRKIRSKLNILPVPRWIQP